MPWTFGERLFLVIVCEAFLIFIVTVNWASLQEREGDKVSWADKYPKLFRTIFGLAILLMISGAVVSLVFGGYPFSAWPSLTVTWVSDGRHLVLVCLGLACAVVGTVFALTMGRAFSGPSFVQTMRNLTVFMVGCVDHADHVGAASILVTAVFWITAIAMGAVAYYAGEIRSPYGLIAVVLAMVAFTFVFSVYETALARYERAWAKKKPKPPWRTKPARDLLSNWFAHLDRRFRRNKVSFIQFQFAFMSFRLCSSYLENAARSLSALIALGAFVDITGTVYITSFVHADASKPIPEHLLETIIVTVPLVVFGYFLGTVIGMRMPIRVLLRLSIPIWIVYMPASLVVGLTAEAAGSVAKILKGDPGYRKDEDQD